MRSHLPRIGSMAVALVAMTTCVALPVTAQGTPAPGDPVWGAYAAGLGYPVNSEWLQERAALEGIDPRCLMTVTVAWSEHPRIVYNVGLGLLEPLVEFVPLVEAQKVMYENSAFFNSEIDCYGRRDGDRTDAGGGPPGGRPPPRGRPPDGGQPTGGGGPPGPPPPPQPEACSPQRPAGDPDLETGPGSITQWFWNAGLGVYCGYLRSGGGLIQYRLEPSGNGYYLQQMSRATSSFERVMRLDRGPAPDPSTGWVEAGEVLRINPDGTLTKINRWWGRVP